VSQYPILFYIQTFESLNHHFNLIIKFWTNKNVTLKRGVCGLSWVAILKWETVTASLFSGKPVQALSLSEPKTKLNKLFFISLLYYKKNRTSEARTMKKVGIYQFRRYILSRRVVVLGIEKSKIKTARKYHFFYIIQREY
jgi:hypothetical protein